MKETTEKYLEAFDLGGPVLLARLVIEDECEDDFVASTSKIKPYPKMAMHGILMVISHFSVLQY
jgi:hypothetical protein